MQNKVLVFDMDGTIANLYGVENWLEMLQMENTLPYEIASPMYNMEYLVFILNLLKLQGWIIVVTTWGAKNASIHYNESTAIVKQLWLKKYNFPYDYFFYEKYGTLKNSSSKFLQGRQILIDDNKTVRQDWQGETIDATKNILEELKKLLTN